MYPLCHTRVALTRIDAFTRILDPFSVLPHLDNRIRISIFTDPYSGIPSSYIFLQKRNGSKRAMAFIFGVQVAHGYGDRDTHRSEILYTQISKLGFVIGAMPRAYDTWRLPIENDVVHHDTAGRIPAQKYFIGIDFVLLAIRYDKLNGVNAILDPSLGALF